MKKIVNLMIVIIILINIVIMVKLCIKILEKKASTEIKNKYNLVYNVVEKKDKYIEVENFILFVRLYTGDVGTNCLKDSIIKFVNNDFPKLFNKIYNLNNDNIDDYYKNEKESINTVIEINNSTKFKYVVQSLQKSSQQLGNCKRCKLDLDSYKEDEKYAYLRLELEYESGLKFECNVQFAMNGNHSGELYTKFLLIN